LAKICEKHRVEKTVYRCAVENGKTRNRHICLICSAERRRAHFKRHGRIEPQEQRRARSAVDTALKNGTLERMPCERCGERNAQAHHDDYSKPLNVMWLCPKHHRERHRELAAQVEGEAA
jgi:hypothetical protein